MRNPRPAPALLPAAARSVQELFDPLLPPPLLTMYLAGGTMLISRVIYIAAELGLADLLAQGPRDVDELAKATETDPDSLFRVLRTLEALGLVTQDCERVFQNTPLALGLRSDVPGSMRAWVRYFGGAWHWHAFSQVLGPVKTGKTIPENSYGAGLFDFFATSLEHAQRFDEAMTSISDGINALLLSAYDFAGLRSVVDVGGGQGRLLAEILRIRPEIQGTLFDRPEVIERARRPGILADYERAGRCQFVGGSLLESLPPAHDAYLFKEALHHWKDPEVRQILEVTREAAGGPGKKILIMEMCVDPIPENALAGKLLDLLMLAMLGGRERTPREFKLLLSPAGFQMTRVIRTLPYTLIEGVSI
ncbi:acetylserotonin O-methyltransferase [Hyalangium versicolor]|uniref:acetylserotonin O-methyltransferase n=1 Tax=Hyalangium versicolor TaxID=2861190 RepID=UPI001CCAB160|nr:acetylserotonin O-methyltransferase [Hyalangium versicolor]